MHSQIIKAGNQVNLLAAQNTTQESSRNSSEQNERAFE
jgi:hypothetical protein